MVAGKERTARTNNNEIKRSSTFARSKSDLNHSVFFMVLCEILCISLCLKTLQNSGCLIVEEILTRRPLSRHNGETVSYSNVFSICILREPLISKAVLWKFFSFNQLPASDELVNEMNGCSILQKSPPTKTTSFH